MPRLIASSSPWLAVACSLLGAAPAADPPMMATAPAETIRLWQDDAPAAKGKADHDVPVVAWWPVPQATSPTAAIVVCPGGGYGGLADHEGTDYAKWLNSRDTSPSMTG